MAIFANEAAMQMWMAEQLENVDGFGELVESSDVPEPKSIEEGYITKSYEFCLDALNFNIVISANENISLDPGDILKPDFLLYSSESEAVVVVELKNQSGPTRQAGTELGAYTAEIKQYLPFIAGSDVISIVVSPDWPVLLRHYIFNEIVWGNKRVVCLRPIQRDDQIKLELVPPEELIEGNLSVLLSDEHLGGFHISLYDMELYRGGARERISAYVEQMQTATKYIAAKGRAQSNNGFAFLWKNERTETLAPYFITVVNVAPFKMLERFVRTFAIEDDCMLDRIIKKVAFEYSPEGHGASIGEQYKDSLKFLRTFCSAQSEGFLSWPALKAFMIEHSTLISFEAWGIFEKSLFEELEKAYANNNTTLKSNDPELGMSVLNTVIDSNYQYIDLRDFYAPPDDQDEDDY
ncbi:hypothetical protein [Pseudomonas simiae]|jgi:hypothetical protein|uniref:Uncharacterized protein n=2 Tax=Pseudomonas simiae TaxID=321846 RepID=U1THT5_9PSED|nr:hypothetical protein [Pseudomonas simiae]VVO03752.1 hypothetical protein PS708_02861 [Pseudomonas fluorescens]AJP52264.1 hypothetical protein PF1751_v1c25640 [Pseudomonas simiae]AJZ97530.1 hypothetical protein PFLUOLIPICF7_24210 [Pseudomonas simiae]ERH58026.1 hypothetical protein O204_24265 [Pseudomonas simiae]MBI6614754.1 hypothetical protein [Pseudomonas simiae]